MAKYFKNIEHLSNDKTEEFQKMLEKVKAEKPGVQENLKEEDNIIPKKTRFAKKISFLATAVFILAFGILFGWYMMFYRSSVSILVQDQKTNAPLSNVEVTLDGRHVSTDVSGVASFKNLKTGEKIITISYSGYKETSQLVDLRFGDNGRVTVSIDVVRLTMSGVVLDRISKTPIPDALVGIGETSTAADLNGNFSLKEILPGNQKINVSHQNYNPLYFNFVTTQGTEDNLGDIQLSPKGRAVFSSNRDGDEAVYSALFDGSSAVKLWDNVKGYDDSSPLLSPDKKWIFFYSSRDNERDNYGNLKSKPYYYGLENKEVRKISDDSSVASPVWSIGGELLYISDETSAQNITNSQIKSFDFNSRTPSSLAKDSDFEDPEASGSASIVSLITSPAESKVAFVVGNSQDSSFQGVYTVKTDGTELTKISGKYPNTEFRFTNDGLGITLDVYEADSIRRYEINLESGEEAAIPFESKRRGYYSPSSGYSFNEVTNNELGKKAYIDYRDGKNDLYLSNLDGSEERRLTNSGGVDKVFFMQGEKHFIYSINLPNEASVYAIGIESSSLPVKISDLYPGGLAGVLNE